MLGLQYIDVTAAVRELGQDDFVKAAGVFLESKMPLESAVEPLRDVAEVGRVRAILHLGEKPAESPVGLLGSRSLVMVSCVSVGAWFAVGHGEPVVLW